MTIGDRIKKLREQVGLGQGELAKTAGISQGYMSQVEGGDVKSISLQVAVKLAEALGVSVYDLMGKKQVKVAILPALAAHLSQMSMSRQKRLLNFLSVSKE